MLDDGTELRSRAVLLAMGVSYRRLGIPSLEALLGRGVFYGAATAEASAVRGEHVFVVGGGNSAGQAAVHLAKYAGRVTILVRGSSLAATMSDYLIKEIGRADNLEVRYNTEVVDGEGQAKLDRLVLRETRSGTRRTVPAFALFVLIGAHPNTDWLPTEIQLDEKGFVLTGADVRARSPLSETFRPPYLLETSISGVFAAGDIRHGSEKRVAAAVGEGSTAIRLIHQHLNKLEELAVRK